MQRGRGPSKSATTVPKGGGKPTGKSATLVPTPPPKTTVDGNVSLSPENLLTITEEHKRQLREAFDLFDTEGKGFIKTHEVVVALYALGYEVSNTELGQLIEQVGATNSECIDFNEFYLILVQKMKSRETRTECVRAFKQIDEEDKGYLTVDDLRGIAMSLRMDLTEDELSEMILFARSLGHQSVNTNAAEFGASDALVVTEEDFLRLMKRANVY